MSFAIIGFIPKICFILPKQLLIIYGNVFGKRFLPVTEKIISDWQPIYRSINHQPLNFETDEYRNFLMQTLAKLERFKEKYPFISCKKETELLLTLLNLV